MIGIRISPINVSVQLTDRLKFKKCSVITALRNIMKAELQRSTDARIEVNVKLYSVRINDKEADQNP